jgi:serine/threonine protein kinase
MPYSYTISVCYVKRIVWFQANVSSSNLSQPQNLLLTGAYPDCDIKLCDFGISRFIQSGVEVREILGTPDYVGMVYHQLNSVNGKGSSYWALLYVLRFLHVTWFELMDFNPYSFIGDIWFRFWLELAIVTGFSRFYQILKAILIYLLPVYFPNPS